MRSFTDLSALPGHTVVIDGEAYPCPDLVVQDMQGSVRKIPAERILAVQWHGAHNHGSIEGYGAMEGFSDKTQLAPFVSAWLRARAKAKIDKMEAIIRNKKEIEDIISTNKNTAENLRSDIQVHPDRADAFRIHLENLVAQGKMMEAKLPTDAMIEKARNEASAAQDEVDADA